MANDASLEKCKSSVSDVEEATNISETNNDNEADPKPPQEQEEESSSTTSNQSDANANANANANADADADDHNQMINRTTSLLKSEPDILLDSLSQEIDGFISFLSTNTDPLTTLSIPHDVNTFFNKLRSKIAEYEPVDTNSATRFGQCPEEDELLLSSVDRLSKLIDSLESQPKKDDDLVLSTVLNDASSVLQRAMLLLEDELRFILDEPHNKNLQFNANINCKSFKATTKQQYSFKPGHLPPDQTTATTTSSSNDNSNSNNNNSSSSSSQTNHSDHHHQQQQQPGMSSDNNNNTNDNNNNNHQVVSKSKRWRAPFPAYSDQDISIMSSISRSMILAGYELECLSVFHLSRRIAFLEELNKQGLEKMSVDDVQKMQWEQLEIEIAAWIRLLKHCSSNLLPGEQTFYQSVFPCNDNDNSNNSSSNSDQSRILLTNLAHHVVLQLTSFAQAVSMTRRSTEKLFKFLDMYETLRDLEPSITAESYTEEGAEEIGAEIALTKFRLGEAAVAIFCELETSIRSDNVKQPVPSGAVHPLIRYTMNYLKYACEYRETLEEVFLRQSKPRINSNGNSNNTSSPTTTAAAAAAATTTTPPPPPTPFVAQLMRILDLIDTNLDARSHLYKDVGLRYIFLLNNGRYMLQKVRSSPEIHCIVRDTWCRRQSTSLRQYHKAYQRETWGKVLQCLTTEGIQVNGKVHKPVLKERFKSFNALFDEIHKAQSTWVVSDEQMQSELRVSISAVMIPAYRAFLARFGQLFTPGRQYEKYVKYQPDDIEHAIDELFEGNASSMVRRSK